MRRVGLAPGDLHRRAVEREAGSRRGRDAVAQRREAGEGSTVARGGVTGPGLERGDGLRGELVATDGGGRHVRDGSRERRDECGRLEVIGEGRGRHRGSGGERTERDGRDEVSWRIGCRSVI